MASTAIIREWARAQGMHVLNKGRMAPAVHAAYRAAHPDATIEPPAGATKCPRCTRYWTGLRECHCTVCHLHFSSVRSFDEHRRLGDVGSCINPLTISTSRNDNSPKYKQVETAWGKLIVLASERPDLFTSDEDEETPVLL